MSVQAGFLNFDAKPADAGALLELSVAAAPFGPDGDMSRTLGALAMLYKPFNTISESRQVFLTETMYHPSPPRAHLHLHFDQREGAPGLIT